MLKLIHMMAVAMAADGSTGVFETDKSFETMEQCQTYVTAEMQKIETTMLGGGFKVVQDRNGKPFVILDLYCRAEGFKT